VLQALLKETSVIYGYQNDWFQKKEKEGVSTVEKAGEPSTKIEN